MPRKSIEQPIEEPAPEQPIEEPAEPQIEEAAPEEIIEEPKIEAKPKPSKCPKCHKRGQSVFGLFWDEQRKLPMNSFACEGCKTIYFE